MHHKLGSVFLVLSALLIAAPSALAHALLKRASPAAESTVRSAPAEIALRFTESIEPDVSTVQVTGAGGKIAGRDQGSRDSTARHRGSV